MSERWALWVSTSPATRGGIATYVRAVQQTALWSDWNIRHVTTHRDGSKLSKVTCFLVGCAVFAIRMICGRPHVVHIHSASGGSFIRKACLLWFSRALRVPVVLHIHGSGIEDFYRNAYLPARLLIRATLQNASVVLALGQSWATRLGCIAPRARIEVIPNGVRVAPAVRQPLAGEPLQIVFLGRVGQHKGVFDLLDAWAELVRVNDTGDAVTTFPVLTIAGDGQVQDARKQVSDRGLEDSVQVTGWLSAEMTEGLLNRAHVLVLPSRGEGQPMAVLEAMARGLCVIASDVGGIPEMITGGCGVLVRPGDVEGLTAALKRVVYDEGLREQCGAAAHARVATEYCVDSVSQRLDALYQEVCR